MIDGALSLGAPVLLYDVDDDLKPSVLSLERLLARSDPPIRSVIVAHYFGAPVDLGPIMSLCRRHGASLIEDCSHVMVLGPGPVMSGGTEFGVSGDHAVASPYKFSPAPFGGLGWAARHQASGATSGASIPPLRMVVASARQRLTRPVRADVSGLPARLEALLARPMPTAHEWIEPAAPSTHYDTAQANAPADLWSQSLWYSQTPADVAAARVDHYHRLHAGLRQVPHARPLWAGLPEDCIPYMFPLWLDHPDFHFPLLKRLGVPIWRWDEMAISDCRFASAARTGLLHLPCHQSLRDDEIDWMIEAFHLVLQRTPCAKARCADDGGLV